MDQKKLLIVDPDTSLTQTLQAAFTQEGYEVHVAHTGQAGLELAHQHKPEVVILEIMLPDMNGHELLAELFNTPTLLFLKYELHLSQRNYLYAIGMQDYLTKPFDLEELKLRVKNLFSVQARINPINPISKLAIPTYRLELELKNIIKTRKNWTYFDLKIKYLRDFNDVYGYLAADEIVRITAVIITNTMRIPDDFAMHVSSDNFVLLTYADDPAKLAQYLVEQFNVSIKDHYSLTDHQQQIPLMTLDVGWVSWTSELKVDDLREIVDLAIEDRRRRSGLSKIDPPQPITW